MKVLYFVHTFYPELNGISIHLHSLTKSVGEGVECVVAPGKGMAVPGFSSMKLPILEFFRALSMPCDLVHVHGYSFFTAAGAILARIRGKPLVWTVHGVPKFTDKRKHLLGLYNLLFLGWLKSADEIISVSHDELTKKWERADRPINYLPNGVDTELFRPQGSYKEGKYAGYIGRLDKDKGVEELMAVRSLPVLFAGPDEGMLERLRAMGPLEYKQLPHEQMPQIYTSCRYVILPSKYEGYPLTMLEALACGQPFVARPVGEIPSVMRELFGEEKWQKYMLAEGEGAIEAKIAELEKEDLGPELAAAREKIEQTLSWKVVAAKTKAIYEQALAKKKQTQPI